MTNKINEAYVIHKNKLVGKIETSLETGFYQAAYNVSKEKINANREFNLVNSFEIKLSRKNAWRRIYDKDINAQMALIEIINNDEFYIHQ